MSTEIREPILLNKLRTALSHLYSLNNVTNSGNQHEAHDYLIEFQSRNVRRKATSLYQRKRDSLNDLCVKLEADDETNGSSLYASLPFLLFTVPSHNTERLFCAQTILHRLRRMKTSEALDLEIEHYDSARMNVNVLTELLATGQNSQQNTFQYWVEFVKFHGEKLSSYHINLLGKVFQNYFKTTMNVDSPSFDNRMLSISPSDAEEKIKGEIAMLVLATISYLNVYEHTIRSELSGQEDGSHITPLLETLSSAMAVVALRLRYTSASVASDCAASETPIVTIVATAFQSVAEVASLQTYNELLPGALNDETVNQKVLQQNQNFHKRALSRCLCVALASIPDSLLGGPGGARGRLSVDPKCIVAANAELRSEGTGIGLLKEAIAYLIETTGSIDNSRGTEYMQRQILISSEKWSKFVPLNLDFVQYTLSNTMNGVSTGTAAAFTDFDKAFCSYLVRIFEGASLSVEQVMASAAGITAESSRAGHQPGRQKQSSKARKRQKERMDDVLSGGDEKRREAEKEAHLRGSVACHAAMWTWERVFALLMANLNGMEAAPHDIVDGEGPVGCICTCVSACLPHFIKHGKISEDESQSIMLVRILTEALQNICSNENRSVRALTYEHIAIVHKALMDNSKTANLSEMAMRCVCQSTLVLSGKCRYPQGYFSDLTENNDEDVEIERNDVRDLLRSVCTLEVAASQDPHVSLMILNQIVEHCIKGISDQSDHNNLPPETIIHALSAPAKSLQILARVFVQSGEVDRHLAEKIIHNSLDCLSFYCEKLLDGFSKSLPMSETLPASRLICITVASFAPFYATMIEKEQSPLLAKTHRSIGLAILAIAASISNLPELIAESSLDNTRYDIRGAVRAPGGEDHCGCIALMRIVKAGEGLARSSLECASQISKTDIITTYKELAKVYISLHTAEIERPPGQLHGKGVTPKSRRVFLTALSKIGLSTMKAHPTTSESISAELKSLFQKPIDVIISCKQRTDVTHAQAMFILCEACFDLSAFPPKLCKELFAVNGFGTAATEALIEACLNGFTQSSNEEPSESAIQWGRLRGATVALLRSSADCGFECNSVEALKALINAECNAVVSYCKANRDACSSIFHELVVSEEVCAAGSFVITVRDGIAALRSQISNNGVEASAINVAIPSFVSSLLGCKDSVFSAIGSNTNVELSEWEDPRPTIFEAWLLTINELIEIVFEVGCQDETTLLQLVSETLVVTIQVLLHKRVDKEITYPGEAKYLSLDGPHTLAMVEFFELSFKFGPSIFAKTASLITSQVNLDLVSTGANNTSLIGGAIIVAAIYRCVSGAVPPWAVEYVPTMLKSLYSCCGNGPQEFSAILLAGADLKLNVGHKYGCVQKTLAGHYYDTIKPKKKEDFIIKALEISASDGNDKWRQLKVLVKHVCGGKKKASEFNLKPQFTTWECDRI
jgi:hypothetical protein